MAQLPILEFPDPRLRTVAAPVDPALLASPQFQRLIDDMFETMYAAPGIGLAATQVDAHHRFMVIDVSEGKDQPLVFVNPQILARQGEQVYQEGCLSVPGIFADVTRADAITVRYLDRDADLALAQAYCSDAFVSVAASTIQLHGGIGFTWEHDAHLFFKRARSIQTLLGTGAWHREEAAKMILGDMA